MSRIKGLDSLRAIGFLLVFLVHMQYINFGWVMQIFFVLSGFLITGILVDMRRDLSGRDFFVKFYGRRFLRIFPLYYFYLLLAVLATLVLARFGFGGLRGKIDLLFSLLPSALLYLYNFFTLTARDVFPITHHLWSLCVEEQFYLIWPVLIFITREKNYNKLFISAIALGLIFRVLFALANHAGYLPAFSEGPARAIFVLPFSHLDAFGLGAYISQNKITNSSRQFGLLSLLLPLIGLLYNFLVLGQFTNVSSLGYPYLMEYGYQYTWGYSVANYWAAVLIDAIAKEGLFERFLSFKPLIYLGKISYGMYVYHLGVVWLMYRVLVATVPDPSEAVIFATAILQLTVTIILASISYRYFEMPLLNLKNKYFRIAGDPPYLPAQHAQS